MPAKLFVAIGLWLSIVMASLAWNLHRAEAHRETLALETARSFFDLLLITRRWNAQHGGVYVPLTPKTPPNPYLDDPRREIRVTDDLTLTKINPSYVMANRVTDRAMCVAVSASPCRP
ncbi:MAG: hypothetical protein ACUVT0_05610 [Thermochromatium sp.]